MRCFLLFNLLVFLAGCSAPDDATHRLFVTNEADGTVTVIDSRSLEVEKTVTVGNRPRGIGFSPDHRLVYVALGNDNAIGVLDARSLELVKTISAGSDPEAFAVHPNGTIYLTNEDDALATALIRPPARFSPRFRWASSRKECKCPLTASWLS